jgi:drug/metabolite transporter (DMT)-like permease
VPKNKKPSIQVAVTASLAMIAFASNSIICRLALGDGTIDAGSFSIIRLLSGAAMLWVLSVIRKGKTKTDHSGSWISASMLFLYAFAFSFAYIELNAGTGTLILFGAVQLTMLLTGIVTGERPHPLQWLGLMFALGGMIYLVSPGLEAPSVKSSGLMAIAGIAWGIYSLRGRGNSNPAAVTTDNFIRSIPFVLITVVFVLPQLHITITGAMWAVISGAVTSGIGYVIWYAALRGLTATRAAIVQLSVPVLAAIGGVLLLSEVITPRLLISAILTLGGISLAIIGREKKV